MHYNFWEKRESRHKIGQGCSTPLRLNGSNNLDHRFDMKTFSYWGKVVSKGFGAKIIFFEFLLWYYLIIQLSFTFDLIKIALRVQKLQMKNFQQMTMFRDPSILFLWHFSVDIYEKSWCQKFQLIPNLRLPQTLCMIRCITLFHRPLL